MFTVIVQLTPGITDFHVAGKAQMAVYKTAGSAHMFCSQAWHRSGTAQRRTIKVAYFFDVLGVFNVEKGDGQEPEVDPKIETFDSFEDIEIKPTVGASSSTDAAAAVAEEEPYPSEEAEPTAEDDAAASAD